MKNILSILLVSINIFSCSSTNNSEDENDSTSTELQNDNGYLKFNDNYWYVGELKDGKPHGRGTLRATLISDVEILKLIKEGKFEDLKNKDIMLKYVGDWINGERNGYGIEWYADGTCGMVNSKINIFFQLVMVFEIWFFQSGYISYCKIIEVKKQMKN